MLLALALSVSVAALALRRTLWAALALRVSRWRAAVERAFAAFSDPRNAPVYLYCDHGRDRTGYVVALYRARKQRWSWPAIRAELERHGHGWVMRRYLPDVTRQLEREAARAGA